MTTESHRTEISRTEQNLQAALFDMHEAYVRPQHRSRVRRTQYTGALLVLLLTLTALIAGGVTEKAHAAEEEVITRSIYVHHVPGRGAWMQSAHHLTSKPGSRAAFKVTAMQPGERVHLYGAKHGTYRVEGIIFPPTKPYTAAELSQLSAGWDLRMTVRGTERYVFCNRIR